MSSALMCPIRKLPTMPEGAWAYFVAGLVLGLSAGISPGPLMTLVIAESLSRSAWNGIKVGAAPLLTDAPIVALAVFVLAKLAHLDMVFGLISFAGCGFLIYLGVESLRTEKVNGGDDPAGPSSLRKGMVTNFLSPHPYLFWMSVGAPMVLAGAKDGLRAPLGFLIGFYVCLVGSKVVVALIVGRFRDLLSGRGYRLIMKALGAALFVLAGLFLVEGLGYFGISILP